MELKEKNTEALKTDFKKTKKIIQIATIVLLIVFGFFIYSLFTGNDSRTTYTFVIIALVFVVILFDKKIKKIKSELDSRE